MFCLPAWIFAICALDWHSSLSKDHLMNLKYPVVVEHESWPFSCNFLFQDFWGRRTRKKIETVAEVWYSTKSWFQQLAHNQITVASSCLFVVFRSNKVVLMKFFPEIYNTCVVGFRYNLSVIDTYLLWYMLCLMISLLPSEFLSFCLVAAW